MNKKQNFLVKYGLHNFVTVDQESDSPIFFIKSQEDQSMINHAMNLIQNDFGETTPIKVI